MLHKFLTSNQDEIIKRCRENTRQRFEPSEAPAATDHGVPLFLQQLAHALRLEQETAVASVTEPAAPLSASEVGRSAALHGAELLRLGYSIDQVVHEYGDICQSVTAIAIEQNAKISADEFRTLNRCLDDAIADAVTSFGRARQTSLNDQARTWRDRLTAFSDEHRRLVDIVAQAYSAIRTGNVGLGGATGALLSHTLSELRSLPERFLAATPPGGVTT